MNTNQNQIINDLNNNNNNNNNLLNNQFNLNENINKSNNSISNSAFNLINQDNSNIDINNQIINNQNENTIKYINLIENELKSLGHTLNDSLFYNQIITILDKLSSPNNFNRTLFNHIINYAKFDIEKPIKIFDFFEKYFEIYDKMKESRDKLALENINENKIIEQNKLNIIQLNNTEFINEDGLSNNSKLEFIFKILKSDVNNININKTIKNIYIVFGNEKIIFDINQPFIKKTLLIKNMQQLENLLFIYIKSNNEDKLIDTINPKNLLENPTTKNFDFFEISFLWINSMINYLQKKINLLEKNIQYSKDNISLLNTSINQLENILKNYFTQVPRSEHSNIISNLIGNEMEISDKIENFILKTIGQEAILIWDIIVFYLIRILLFLCFIECFQRFDLISIVFCFIIIFIENNIFSKKYIYYFLSFLIGSFLIDFAYLIIESKYLKIIKHFENPERGKLSRKITFILNIIKVIIKVILSFCLWKVSIQYKLELINLEHSKRVKETEFDKEFNRKFKRINFNTQKKNNSNNKSDIRGNENINDEIY